MSLTVTACGTDSNSYVTIAEMDAFVAEQITSDAVTAWTALVDANKEKYLIQVCRQIDRAHRYVGRKITSLTGDDAQALEFPRFSFDYTGGKANLEAYRSDGTYAVDERVKRAQMLQALHLVQIVEVEGGDPMIGGGTRAKLQAEGVTQIRTGNTSESYNGKVNSLCAAAEQELAALVRKASRI